MYFMTLRNARALRFRRLQVFGKRVQSPYCPRNGRREKPLGSATAPSEEAREGER
jgi:hypothetical protein